MKEVLPALRFLLAVGLVLGLAADAFAQKRAVMPAFAKKVQTAGIYDDFPEPKPGDWQFEQREPDQSFSQYVQSQPVRATKQRKFLYVQTLGEFTEKQEEILDKTCEYLEIFYGLEVRRLKPLSDSIVPKKARRILPGTVDHVQFNVMYLMEKVLYPRLPENAAACLMFTSTDLWPGNDWNFCFGYAAYRYRIGVWSIARNGDPEDEQQYTDVLRRTLRLATHETGHMFSMLHCIRHRCNMNGSNSLEESDTQPLEMCPVCLAKLHYAVKFNFRKRWTELQEFYEENGLLPEAEFAEACLEAQ